MKKVLLTIALGAVVAGCAGRDPHLQPVAHSRDNDMSCKQIEAEAQSLAANARTKIASNQQRDGGDAALGVAGALLFWPALLAMDVKNADGVEGNNLADRVDHLRRVAADKGCDTSGYPSIQRYQ